MGSWGPPEEGVGGKDRLLTTRPIFRINAKGERNGLNPSKLQPSSFVSRPIELIETP